LWSSREESMTSKVGFYPGNIARGTKYTSGLVARHKAMEISWLLSGEHLVE